MIPIELRVRNFMCYRDDVPPLSFEGIHLACLTGSNGHGKSALLDAITWAVWGKSRAKHDDELIHQGQTDMEVEYTFDLGGSRYRITRKRESKRPGRTVLELQVQGADKMRSIGGSTIRATQEAIDKLLRMDYDTFTNSAFLLQGKADSFTTRTASERKQVLADILGLGRWDEYEQEARDRSRAVERDHDFQDARLKQIDSELARAPEYEAALARVETRIAQLAASVQGAEAGLALHQSQLQALERQQVALQGVERHLAQTERELGEIDARVRERQARLQGYEKALSERGAIEQGFAALTAARQAESAWNERLGTARRVESQQRDLERAVAAARQALEQEAGRLAERLRALEKHGGEVPRLELELAEAESRLGHLARRQAERDAARERLQALAEAAAALKATNEKLRAEMLDLRDKLDLLEVEAGEAACPLCGQPLTGQHRKEIAAEYQAKGEGLRRLFDGNDAELRAGTVESAQIKAQLQQLDRELAGQGAAQGRHAQAEHALREAQQAGAGVQAAGEELAALRQRVEAGDYAHAEHRALAQLAAELESTGYDAEAHRKARDEAANLAPFEARQQQLLLAGQQAETERAALEELRGRRERWTEGLAAERERRDALAAEVAGLPGVREQVRARSAELEEWQRQAHQARLALGAATQLVEHVRQMGAERVRVAAQRERLAAEKALLDELRLAFGKKGVQAMIIEAAIPEIEYEANELLARMTQNRMHVRMNTQRLTQKGDPQETLEITISDELGTRPYELFSGGETFRVNFSIRIALSKLLARRAGAQLQMLVIDEGFGTQDAEGRERLVEAITAIQEDFERILVITHIEELKDAFPVRIEVTKTEQGSQFRLS